MRLNKAAWITVTVLLGACALNPTWRSLAADGQLTSSEIDTGAFRHRVLANDVDADGDPLTAVLVTDVANGSLTLGVDGTFVYVPDANFSGIDQFQYVLRNSDGGEATATVTVTVDPVDDAPVARDDIFFSAPDTPLILDVATDLLANDSDPDGDTLSLDGFDQPAQRP